jgi:hypothetical protein
MAEALAEKLDDIERIDRLTSIAERQTRQNEAKILNHFNDGGSGDR